jgi:hypothetical protein
LPIVYFGRKAVAGDFYKEMDKSVKAPAIKAIEKALEYFQSANSGDLQVSSEITKGNHHCSFDGWKAGF